MRRHPPVRSSHTSEGRRVITPAGQRPRRVVISQRALWLTEPFGWRSGEYGPFEAAHLDLRAIRETLIDRFNAASSDDGVVSDPPAVHDLIAAIEHCGAVGRSTRVVPH